tara:strand:+ start:1172 stop:1357 length:186 start_codon:yes stop_codon:yes gene_type:complete
MSKIILMVSAMGCVSLFGISLSLADLIIHTQYVTYAQTYMLMLSSMASALLLSLTIIEVSR